MCAVPVGVIPAGLFAPKIPGIKAPIFKSLIIRDLMLNNYLHSFLSSSPHRFSMDRMVLRFSPVSLIIRLI